MSATTLNIGDKVRELPDHAVKQDSYLQFLHMLSGNDWSELPDQLEGVVTSEYLLSSGETGYMIEYTNAPSWAPKGAPYSASSVELLEAHA